MRGPRRHVGGLVVAILGGILGVAGVAWACTPQAGISPLPIQAAAPRTEVAVSGQSTTPGTVEIRWNGLRGPVLATASADKGEHGTGFDTTVAIPDVAPGVYYLVLAAGDHGVGRAAIEVTGAPGTSPTPAATTAALWEPLAGDAALSSSGGSAKAGVALLAVGLVALMVGVGVAGVRRRRAQSGA